VAAAIDYVRTVRHWPPANVAHVYRVGDNVPSYGVVFTYNVGSCGHAVVNSSWVVELWGAPGSGNGGSTPQAQVVLAHYADGWHVFGFYH
jgi:hypothetical protein